MSADDEVVVFERSLAEAMVVIVVPVERLTEEVLDYCISIGISTLGTSTNQAVQLVQTLNVGGIASSVLLIDADLVGCEAGLFGLFYGHSDAAICSGQTFYLGAFCICGKRERLQLMPRDSHAASTSGLASCRKIFSFRSEPLNRWTVYVISTSFITGAGGISILDKVCILGKLHTQYWDTCPVQRWSRSPLHL